MLDTKPLAHLTGGRPLGMHYDAAGNLIVCNAGVVSSRISHQLLS